MPGPWGLLRTNTRARAQTADLASASETTLFQNSDDATRFTSGIKVTRHLCCKIRPPLHVSLKGRLIFTVWSQKIAPQNRTTHRKTTLSFTPGSLKCWDSKLHLVVSSEFWKSVGYTGTRSTKPRGHTKTGLEILQIPLTWDVMMENGSDNDNIIRVLKIASMFDQDYHYYLAKRMGYCMIYRLL